MQEQSKEMCRLRCGNCTFNFIRSYEEGGKLNTPCPCCGGRGTSMIVDIWSEGGTVNQWFVPEEEEEEVEVEAEFMTSHGRIFLTDPLPEDHEPILGLRMVRRCHTQECMAIMVYTGNDGDGGCSGFPGWICEEHL